MKFDDYDQYTLAKLMRASAQETRDRYFRQWGTPSVDAKRAGVHMDFVDVVRERTLTFEDVFTVRDLAGHDAPEHVLTKYRRALVNLESAELVRRVGRINGGIEVYWRAVQPDHGHSRATAGRVQHVGARG